MMTIARRRSGGLLKVAFAFVLPACVAAACPARADMSVRSSLQLRVGETRQIAVFGGHSRDCTRSIPPEIRITRSPTRGSVSERQDVPYVAKYSLSGTCLGASFTGTAVDYTASAPGHDVLQLDAVFENGAQHRTVSITNR